MEKITENYFSLKSSGNFNSQLQAKLNRDLLRLDNGNEMKLEESEILSYEDFVQGLGKLEESIKDINSIDLFDSKLNMHVNQFSSIRDNKPDPQRNQQKRVSIESKIDNIKKNLEKIDHMKLEKDCKESNTKNEIESKRNLASTNNHEIKSKPSIIH